MFVNGSNILLKIKRKKTSNYIQTEITKINSGKGATPTAKLKLQRTHPENRTFSRTQIFSAQKHIAYNCEWNESPQEVHYKVTAHKVLDSYAKFAK